MRRKCARACVRARERKQAEKKKHQLHNADGRMQRKHSTLCNRKYFIVHPWASIRLVTVVAQIVSLTVVVISVRVVTKVAVLKKSQ